MFTDEFSISVNVTLFVHAYVVLVVRFSSLTDFFNFDIYYKGFTQVIMWFGVWLNYFRCQMSSGVCVPTWTYIPIALMLLPFMCYVVLCTEASDDLIVEYYFYGHLSAL